MAIAAAGISIALSFVLTWMMGFEDPKEAGEDREEGALDHVNSSNTVFAPISG